MGCPKGSTPAERREGTSAVKTAEKCSIRETELRTTETQKLKAAGASSSKGEISSRKQGALVNLKAKVVMGRGSGERGARVREFMRGVATGRNPFKTTSVVSARLIGSRRGEKSIGGI